MIGQPGLRLCCMVSIISLLCSFTTVHGSSEEPSREELERAENDLQKAMSDPVQQKQLLLGIQLALGSFGYGTGPFNGVLDQKTKAAIRAYQKIRGIKQSGEVDYLTMKKILDDYQVNTKFIPYLSPFKVFTELWDSGYVKAEGTWIIEQDEMARPIQTTVIECDNVAKECSEATAELDDESLRVDTNRHKIERWDAHEIVTAPLGFLCVRYTMRILREQQSVKASRIKTKIEGECKYVTSELRLRLDDGMKIYRAQQTKKREAQKEFLNAPGFEEVFSE